MSTRMKLTLSFINKNNPTLTGQANNVIISKNVLNMDTNKMSKIMGNTLIKQNLNNIYKDEWDNYAGINEKNSNVTTNTG